MFIHTNMDELGRKSAVVKELYSLQPLNMHYSWPLSGLRFCFEWLVQSRMYLKIRYASFPCIYLVSFPTTIGISKRDQEQEG